MEEVRWDEMRNPNKDTPEEIVEGCFKAQAKIISGYKGNEKRIGKISGGFAACSSCD